MGDRITEITCAQALDRYCRMSGQRSDGPWEGRLLVHHESGVKRVMQGVGSSALRNIGPGFITWRELHCFIVGMIEAEYLAADRDPVGI